MSCSSTLQPGQSIRPIVSINQARSLIQSLFGLECEKIKELNSYDDRNFYVEVNGGGKYILKVLNSMDTLKPGHVEAQHGIMFHLARNGINCPVPEKTLEGSTYQVVPIALEGTEDANANEAPFHLVRLLTFVEGRILHEFPITPTLLYNVGSYISHVEQLMKECQFPVLRSHNSMWMLSSVTELPKFLYAVQSPPRVDLVKRVISAYVEVVEPVLQQLESGILHGDYNEQNILVQLSGEEGKEEYNLGLLDFGDLQVGPYIFELAITVTYMMLESVREGGTVEPFQAVAPVVAGYSKYRTVPEIELRLMRILVGCRLCQSLVMGAYSHSLDPQNAYVLTTADRGWPLLHQLWNQTTDDQMFSICNSSFLLP